MGQCFSAMKGKGGGAKPGKAARPTDGNHMGPEGVENSIFLGKDSEPLFPNRRNQNPDLNAEMAPLNELMPDSNGEAANGSPPAPKQAVMRRSFPPVGVALIFEDTIEAFVPDPQRSAQVTSDISKAIAEAFSTSMDRIRIMRFLPDQGVTCNLNIVADRTDDDTRSPMQLAAELVTACRKPDSLLRQAPVCRLLCDGRIAEDPFPGPKQDSWAGGVATLRPNDNSTDHAWKHTSHSETSFKKKKKSKAGAAAAAAAPGNGSTGNASHASNAQTQPTSTSTSEATPRPPEHLPAMQAAERQPQPTAQEMEVSNTSELPGGAITKDGGSYSGELANGQRHGRGKQNYPNGDVFTGCFHQDKRLGIGRLDFANGGFYLGEWKDDEKCGKGSLTYANKDMYVGAWAKGMRDGEGKLLWASGAWYQGAFKKDELHGKGRLQKLNQDKYEGDFFEGKMHGKGTYAPADQDQPPRTGYWCMGEEIVGKSDDEAQLMLREAVFKGRAGAQNKDVTSEELAAKLQHRNARNAALANNQEPPAPPSAPVQMNINPQPPAPAPVPPAADWSTQKRDLPEPPRAPAQPPPPADVPVPVADVSVPLSRGTGVPRTNSGGETPLKSLAGLQAEERRGMPPPPASSMVAKTQSSITNSAGASKKASINEAKPPTRPQRSGANMSTGETLKMVSDKLTQWQSSGATISYGE